jgi:hypothetical protein
MPRRWFGNCSSEEFWKKALEFGTSPLATKPLPGMDQSSVAPLKTWRPTEARVLGSRPVTPRARAQRIQEESSVLSSMAVNHPWLLGISARHSASVGKCGA